MIKPILDPDELQRYARHLVLPEIGGAGQQKLKAARVLVVGAGGLGAPALQYLVAAGVGSLTIVDDDTVSLSNLQRQVIHDTSAVGESKVESAERAIRRINPHVSVAPVKRRFTAADSKWVDGHDVALDCSDNFDTRYALADACADRKVTLVTAAVNRFDGSITTLRPWEDENPGYRDIFPDAPPDGTVPTCAEAGIMGAVTGFMGALQALEAVKAITGAGDLLIGRLLILEGLTMRTHTISYRRTGP